MKIIIFFPLDNIYLKTVLNIYNMAQHDKK